MAETLWCEPDRAKWVGVRPGLYGEQISKYAYGSNANQTIYTVPAGYTLLLDSFVCIGNKFGNNGCECYIMDAVPATIYYMMSIHGNVPNLCYYSNQAFPKPFECLSGYTFHMDSSGALCTVRLSIKGILVDNTLMGN